MMQKCHHFVDSCNISSGGILFSDISRYCTSLKKACGRQHMLSGLVASDSSTVYKAHHQSALTDCLLVLKPVHTTCRQPVRNQTTLLIGNTISKNVVNSVQQCERVQLHGTSINPYPLLPVPNLEERNRRTLPELVSQLRYQGTLVFN